MSIPDFQTLMLPLLQSLADGKEHEFREAVELLSQQYELTELERAELLPSGRAPLFYNRLSWAKTHLKKAGLLELPRRGTFQITDRGLQVLAQPPARIHMAWLQQFPEYAQALALPSSNHPTPNTDSMPTAISIPEASVTPQEAIEQAHQALRAALADEVLTSVKQCSPVFFEQLVVQLMIKMGYGGSRQEAGQAVGKSGDGGIDGIINEDRLGLDSIYLQAKRWEGVVGRPEIMKFVGALAGQRATKGVFITTSSFTQEAKAYAASSQYRLVLIDGARLADLMVEHDLGVSVAATYHLKRIDSDFFSEE